jgi:hypothetical protein
MRIFTVHDLSCIFPCVFCTDFLTISVARYSTGGFVCRFDGFIAKSGLGVGFARGGRFLVLGLIYNNSATGALGLEFFRDVDSQSVHRTKTL